MSLRRRILLASVFLIAVPLALLGFGIHQQMQRRLTAQYTGRVETLMAIITEDLTSRRRLLAERLAALRSNLAQDNRFRLAISDPGSSGDSYLLDHAAGAMQMLGFDMLQIQDDQGRILSSGHFRNAYGRLEPALPRLLAQAPEGTALLRVQRPDGAFLALARLDSVRLGGQMLRVIGGVQVDRKFLGDLARDRQLAVSLVVPGGAVSSDHTLQQRLEPAGRDDLARPELSLGLRDFIVRAEDLPSIQDRGANARLRNARLIVTHPRAPLRDLLRSLNIWLAAAMLITLLGAVIMAAWLAGRISRPLRSLARQTADLDLDRLDVDFPTGRSDEVGVLSRTLAGMTLRLRTSVARLREAERQATLGELARQVNHDIRNGFTPLRNVIRHLAGVARSDPADLARIFRERQGTLEAGLGYLENLAANYARLTPARSQQSCSLNEVVQACTDGLASGGGVQIRRELAAQLPRVLADPVGLRRIVENLLANARQSFTEGGGVITIRTRRRADPLAAGVPVVELSVADTGRGISRQDQDRIFDDFFTTRPEGTGLGLSNVRRLVADCGGSIHVESDVGEGATFIITLPAAEPMRATGFNLPDESAQNEERQP